LTTGELIFKNANIYSGRRGDQPAEAMLIRDGKVMVCGSEDEVTQHSSGSAEIRDLNGSAVLPGLVDVHNHHMMAGETDLFQLTFPPTASFAEVLEAVREYASGLEADDWIVGEAWGSTHVDELSREDARRRLDEAAAGRPVVLTDDSHHNKFVNSAALQAAGIDRTTPQPRDGRIVHDPETGEPTGLLFESATLPIVQALNRSSARTPERFQQSCARGVEILNSFGITSFQDAAATIDIMAALHALDQRQELNAWTVSSMLSSEFLFADTIYGKKLAARAEEFRSPQHRPDFVKVALDGVPPTQTAAFLTPYLDSGDHPHGHCGTTTMRPDELTEWLLWTAERGLSAKIHCTGDAAVRTALDSIETVRDAGYHDVKFHIAHGQYVHPDDLKRFADLDVAADISPYLWFPGVIPESIAHVRPQEEAERMQPNRTLIDLGALVAGGSDWPVSVSPNPWEGIQGLVTRMDPLERAEGALWPEQAITLEEAIEVFTINGARAMGIDDVTGSLEAGKSADFVVLNQDPYTVPVEQLVKTEPLETWFRGRRVY
jgi:predicted amidohydrolase YtcJ